MGELENPKMVNEISLKSLRGPMTPCRANGQVLFLISPRKKNRKSFLRVYPVSSCHRNMFKIFIRLYPPANF